MPLNPKIKQTAARIRLLATGHAQWIDMATGKTETRKEPWHIRWAIAGPHPYNWKWIQKHGKQTCGCTTNPLTRKLILINSKCTKHCHLTITQPPGLHIETQTYE